MLVNEAPVRRGNVPQNAQPMDYARALGQQEGYQMAIDFMVALALPINQNVEIDPTFTEE